MSSYKNESVFQEILSDLGSSGYFNKDRVEKIFEEHRSGIHDYSDILWTILNFQVWRSIFSV